MISKRNLFKTLIILMTIMIGLSLYSNKNKISECVNNYLFYYSDFDSQTIEDKVLLMNRYVLKKDQKRVKLALDFFQDKSDVLDYGERFVVINAVTSFSFMQSNYTKETELDYLEAFFERSKNNSAEYYYYKALVYLRVKDFVNAWDNLNEAENLAKKNNDKKMQLSTKILMEQIEDNKGPASGGDRRD